MSEREILVGLASIFVVGIAAQCFSYWLQLPSILLLLAGGVVVGPLTGIVRPDAMFGELLTPTISIAVSLVLFEGALGLRITELPKVGRTVGLLVTLGAFLTWVAGSACAIMLFAVPAALCVLLGAVLVVSGPTVVGPILRHIRPQGPTDAVLKWESILIDPIGATLAVLIFEAILAGGAGRAAVCVAAGLVSALLTGLVVGAVAAGILIIALVRHWVPDFLDTPLSVILVIAAFAASNVVQTESGLLSVVVMALIVANQKWVDVQHIVEFKENLRVLLLSMLFVVLSARLRMDQLTDAFVPSMVLLGILVLVVRPAAVALCTRGSGLSWKDRLFLACVSPRGIVAAGVSSVFALRLAGAGYEDAAMLVPVTFMIIMGTAAIYGLLSPPVARWLGLSQRRPKGLLIIGAHSWSRRIAKCLQEQRFPVVLVDTDPVNVRSARAAGLKVYRESILGDTVLDDMDLGGIGRLLALTANQELNTLVADRFFSVFGRSEVYRLASTDDVLSQRLAMSRRFGRVLFGKDLTFDKLSDEYSDGAKIDTFELTGETDYAQWQQTAGATATPLFLLTKKDDIFVFTVSNPLNPQPGDRIVAWVRPGGRKTS